ncbi:ECF-type sigma factor [Undibacterium curvum]|uniref:Sigma-70 family RNA polymerase sigma factor n=1 Tax=Undibacterium curvum TaxID=2762294 RepID=A0ABR7A5J4_9BURK|nr:ECF-type sigma factor [Undibacterium curvum]MBC3932178.1 sigma-70 family RNA polymerase sigma factor [Undibacterium curvum]
MQDFATVFQQARLGDPDATGRLMQMIYPDLRQLAKSRLRRSGHLTLLNTTELIAELWLRLQNLQQLPGAQRHFFLAYAAKAMRTIVIDYVRKRQAQRHGGDVDHISLDEELIISHPDTSELLRVHEALSELEQLEPRLAQLVELRYFAGLTEEEAAEFLGIARRTVQRDWLKARAWLYEALRR